LEKRDVSYHLTAHAEKAIAERGILRPWIEQVLLDPLQVERDKEDETLRHALGRVPERGDSVLRVIYNETTTPWIVVTAFFDRKARRML
jgi:hypothetical protein